MKWAAALSVAAVILLALWFLPQLGVFLVAADEPEPSDVTFVTYSVSATRTILEEAADRYARGDGPTIVIGTFAPQDGTQTVAPHGAAARQYLVDRGVAPSDVVLLPLASAESQEAEHLHDFLRQHGARRVLAYVADYRVRRSRGSLRHAIEPIGARVSVVAVPDPAVHWDRWWETRQGVSAIYSEYPRLAYYFVRGRL